MKINKLQVKYDQRTLLDISDFDLEISGLTALYGKSGEGKTTFLDALYGLKEEFPVDHDYGDKKLEYVLQENTLFSGLTVYENFAIKYYQIFGVMPSEEAVQHSIEQIDLSVGLQMKTNLMSGGEKKRLQIAIGLLSDPDLLLVDEPTSSLDDSTGDKLISVLKAVSAKYDILVVTHDEKFKLVADRFYELAGGHLNAVA